MDNKEYLISQFNKYNIKIDDNQADKLIKFYNLLINTNKLMNLTAITLWEDVVLKHFIDSCLSYDYLPFCSTILDVGAGAGFPSIPLKILRPDLKIIMIDSLLKRVNFLNMVINELSLTDIKAVHSRAEEYINVSRETFDVVVARAVANMATLSEYCLPFVKIGGNFIAYKANVEQELKDANYAIEVLGGKLNKVVKYNIADENRSLVIVDKIDNTPIKYPRGQNKPRANPIIKK